MRYETIKGHPNYTIYEDGTILNHDTFYIHKHTHSKGKGSVTRISTGIGVKNSVNITISQQLAIHFIPNPENKSRVFYKDKDTTNLTIDNLYWGDYGDHLVKYTPEEAIEARKERAKRSRNKRDKAGLVKPEQRAWRQSAGGKFVRNRNHWIEAKIREPEEGWEKFYFTKFEPSSHCELCNTAFLPKEDYMSQRCLDHDHISRYIRFICCRRCNTGPLKNWDHKRIYLMSELHRYFNRQN
tara:strand:+ start:85 stop:804 length:720 start_codon:yes stop_codon:yes gene_type:complete